MADDVLLPGTGSTVAADEVGGAYFQRMKLDVGGDGVSVPVVGSVPVSGSVSISGTPSVSVSGTPSVTVSGTATVSGTVNPSRAGTGAHTSVNDTATSTTLVAANASRLGGTIYNDSSALLYVLWGAGTASPTNYSVRVYSNGYVEIPVNYTGIVVGVWATDPNDGTAQVSEFSA